MEEFSMFLVEVLKWYSIGIVSTTILAALLIKNKTIEEIRIHDVEKFFMLALGGPIIFVFALLVFLFDATKGLRNIRDKHVNKVLWRSKANRAQMVLFSDKDSDDD